MSYIELTVHKDRLIDHVKTIREFTNHQTKVMVVAKANAYGLGAKMCCQALQDHVDYFSFATLDEALEVRDACGDGVKITLLSEPRKSDIKVLAHNKIDCAVYSLKTMQNLAEYLQDNPELEISTHFKVNTGLNRLGNDDPREALNFWLGKTPKNLLKTSIWSHLQNSELHEENSERNERQLENFFKMTDLADDMATSLGLKSLMKHISNSYAIEFLDNRYNFDMVRGGVMVWENTFTLKVQVKYVFHPKKGETVGYGCTEITNHKYVCDGQHKAAALAIGYADGLSTRLSHSGYVVIQGVKCDIISPVMMDMTIVKIPVGLEVQDEDWCTLIGPGGKDPAMTTAYMRELTGENSRELMAHLGRRIIRKIE